MLQALTQLHVLLWAGEELANSSSDAFRLDEIFTPDKMLPNEEHQNLDKMREQRNLMESEIGHWRTNQQFRSIRSTIQLSTHLISVFQDP